MSDPGGAIWSIRSSTSSSSTVPAPASRLSSWARVRGPMMAEVTAGCATVKAVARWGRDIPVSPASATSCSTTSRVRSSVRCLGTHRILGVATVWPLR